MRDCTAAIATGPVMAAALVGIVINGFTAWLFMRGSRPISTFAVPCLHMVRRRGGVSRRCCQCRPDGCNQLALA